MDTQCINVSTQLPNLYMYEPNPSRNLAISIRGSFRKVIKEGGKVLMIIDHSTTHSIVIPSCHPLEEVEEEEEEVERYVYSGLTPRPPRSPSSGTVLHFVFHLHVHVQAI